MVYVCLNSDGTQITGIFNYPQSAPQPEGYAEIPDDDPRLTAFQILMASTQTN